MAHRAENIYYLSDPLESLLTSGLVEIDKFSEAHKYQNSLKKK